MRQDELRKAISSLSENSRAELLQWIQKPLQKRPGDNPVTNQLNKRQKQLRSTMSQDKAILVSALELSLALGG